MASTVNSKYVKAVPEKVYKAFTDPTLLEKWLVPGEMKGKIGKFDLRVGGGYDMALQYPESENDSPGKTTSKEDQYHTKFLEIIPGERILQSINFNTTEKEFQGEMIMDVTLKGQNSGTLVTIAFENIPNGIKPEDNEKGTESSLQKLAALVE
jgi:uncharacterized protein YndB with AHSA1/START domain